MPAALGVDVAMRPAAEAHRRVESKHVTGELAAVPPEPGGAA
jgi:hypothetical protein